jgi:hypothetical protein
MSATYPIKNRARVSDASVGVPLEQDAGVSKSTHATRLLAFLLGMIIAAIGVAAIIFITTLSLSSLPSAFLGVLSISIGILLLSYFALWFAFECRVIEEVGDGGADGVDDEIEDEIWDAPGYLFRLGFVIGHLILACLVYMYPYPVYNSFGLKRSDFSFG